MDLLYKLVNKQPVPAVDYIDWAEFMGNSKNRIVAQSVYGEVTISTVFLGTDHNYMSKGDPILFETIIFGEEFSDLQWRYSTWEEAEKNHKAICEKYFEIKS